MSEPLCPWIEPPSEEDTAEDIADRAWATRACVICRQHRDLRRANGVAVDWQAPTVAYMHCDCSGRALIDMVAIWLDCEPGYTEQRAAEILGVSVAAVKRAVCKRARG